MIRRICAVILFATPTVSAQTAVIDVVNKSGSGSVSGMVPLAVNVDCIEPYRNNQKLFTSHFVWNFGDDTSSSKHNTLDGWGGAHIYNETGNYIITLTVTDADGSVQTITRAVTVSENTRTKVYISPKGNDNNNGLSERSAVRSPSRVNKLVASNTEILFERGQTHDFSDSTIIIRDVHNVVVGAYGSGNRPVIMGPPYKPNRQVTLISIDDQPGGGTTENITIRDLEFRTPSEASAEEEFNHNAINVGGRDVFNTSVVNCYFDDVGSCILWTKGDYPNGANSTIYPMGCLMQDNVLDVSSRYFTFFSSHNTTMLGNSSIGGSITSFIFRMYADRAFILHNDWQQPAGNREEFAIAGGNHCDINADLMMQDCEPEHENDNWGEYTYLSQNRLDGTIRLGYESGDSYYRWIVIERNEFRRSAPNQSITQTFRHFKYVDHVMVRNNVFLGPNSTLAITGEGITDIRFYNNTGIASGNGNTFVGMHNGTMAPTGAIRIVNNLWISPDYEADYFGGHPFTVKVPSDLDGYSFSNNLWPSDQGDRNTPMSSGSGITESEWLSKSQVNGDAFHSMGLNTPNSGSKPTAGSAADRAAASVAGVFNDYYGNLRPAGRWTAGAVELNGIPPSNRSLRH
jgi:hypothetical protein